MKMVCVELKPNLSSCIETLCKKEYELTLDLLLKDGCVDKGLMERLEILRLFLELTDFGYLRSQYEGYLAEGKKVTFLIYSNEGKADYNVIVE
jgi:hypothetical protein